MSLKQKFIEKYEELFDKKLELQNSDIKVENSNKDDSGILSTVNDSVSNDLHISLDNSEEEESETEKEEKEIIVDKLKTKKIKLNELREIANNLNILLFKEGKTGKMVKKNKLDLIKDIKEFIEMNSK